jgi:hypothetical protein
MLWVNTAGSPPALLIYDATTKKWMVGQASLPSAPVLASVALAEDTPGGNRFTGERFSITSNYTNNGPPAALLETKAWVEGTFQQQVETDIVTKVEQTTAVAFNTRLWRNSSHYPLPNGVHGAPSPAPNEDCKPGHPIYATSGPPSGGTWWSAPSFYMDEHCWVIFDPPIKATSQIKMSYSSIYANFGERTFVSSAQYSPNAGYNAQQYDDSDSNLKEIVLTGTTIAVISTGNTDAAPSTKGYIKVYGFWVDGVWWTQMPAQKVTFASNKGLAALLPDDSMKPSDSSTSVKIEYAVPGDNAIYMPPNTAGWGPDGTRYGIGPMAPVPGVKKYLMFDATGAITTMQKTDPGYVAVTAAGAGNGPYTTRLTFPATFPSGNAPDTDIPATVSIVAEQRATNTEGTDTKKSATVTPA